ncbi:hypothetical protein Pan216_02100 [Planctomycetes bacterium Pan216]|uniref:MoxR-vWA-beta-propeller ternary system domain-containing protein n=1 Tax=Kolteria novifilia TaxID=2527975 RepID=A0A518AXC6_9BACT|nr:hypothetical protein Pan216_02100 [Planctomycetes bacterium Pan216]
MTGSVAVRLPRHETAMLGRLRCHRGITLHDAGESLWLRVDGEDDRRDRIILALPGDRFRVLPDGQLVRPHQLVPKGRIPEGPWHPLAEWMSVSLAPAGFAGELADRRKLTLVRGGTVRDATLLLTSVHAWRDYAASAPRVRLDPLVFAMNRSGDVIIKGSPLPPLVGTRYVERDGVAVEAGWTWEPALEPIVVAQAFGIEEGDLVLLTRDRGWQHLGAGDFVRATRQAARASFEVADAE